MTQGEIRQLLGDAKNDLFALSLIENEFHLDHVSEKYPKMGGLLRFDEYSLACYA